MKDKTLKYSVLKTKASDELDAEVQEEANENTEEHDGRGSSEDNRQDSK